MEIKDIFELIITILAGVLTCIPLVIQLVKYIQEAAKQKNWDEIVALLADMMADAELMFGTGSERKQWVLDNIELAASHIDYDIDLKVIGDMIDKLCAMSKQVNPPVEKTAEGEAVNAQT